MHWISSGITLVLLDVASSAFTEELFVSITSYAADNWDHIMKHLCCYGE